MNQERIDLLERMEREEPAKPVTCERDLSAMLIPALRLARDEERGGKNFLRLLGRATTPTRPRSFRHFLSAQYAEMIGRYKKPSARAARTCRSRSLTWRLHFVMARSRTRLAGTDALKLFSQMTATRQGARQRRAADPAPRPVLVAGLKAAGTGDPRKLELVSGY
jgi:hypothetical protein